MIEIWLGIRMEEINDQLGLYFGLQFLAWFNNCSCYVQFYLQVKGNIYCNGAGAKNWYTGEKTDFTMEDGAMKCESDNKNIILV